MRSSSRVIICIILCLLLTQTGIAQCLKDPGEGAMDNVFTARVLAL